MTPEQLKDLAEWSRKFLADNTCYNLSSDMAESCLFHKWHIAPVLMHLGKREMEKRGFQVRCDNYDAECKQVYIKNKWHEDWELSPIFAEHENEYIAFWTAVREALK